MGNIYTLPVFTNSYIDIDSDYSNLTTTELALLDYFESNALHIYSNPNGTQFNVLREYYAMSEQLNVKIAYYVYNANQIGYVLDKSTVYYTMALYYGGSVGEQPRVRVQTFSRVKSPFSSNVVWADDYNEKDFALINLYDNIDSALAALSKKPISYRLTNCTAPTAPTEASIGESVTVSLQFTSGYGIVNPSSDVYVTNNGVVVPSSYANGRLTFTMPDPS